MFTQKISMDCTKEQYEKYLKEELLKMGYDDTEVTFGEEETIIVNNTNERIGNLSILIGARKERCGRTYLGSFNAPLFLALAAMTDKEDGGYGEYWKFIGETTTNWTVSKLYRANGSTLKEFCPFIYDTGESNGRPYPLRDFQKATITEIKNTFGNPIEEMVTNAHLNQGRLSIIPPVIPITVPYQLCPKCKGEGDLPAFYDPFGQSTTGTSFQRRQCDVCFGNKIIPMHVVK